MAILTGKTTKDYKTEDLIKIFEEINAAIEGLDEATQKAIGLKMLIAEARELEYVPSVRPFADHHFDAPASVELELEDLEECGKVMRFLADVNRYFEFCDEPERKFWTVTWGEFLAYREAKALIFATFFISLDMKIWTQEKQKEYLDGIAQLPVRMTVPTFSDAKSAGSPTIA